MENKVIPHLIQFLMRQVADYLQETGRLQWGRQFFYQASNINPIRRRLSKTKVVYGTTTSKWHRTLLEQPRKD
jgi:hypothetical protein